MPLAVIEFDEAVIRLVAALAGPEIKETTSLSVTVAPLIDAVIVAVPAVADEVSVTV